MSKSKSFLPGAKELLKPSFFHTTSPLAKPSSLAILAATAPSKPLPLAGLSSSNHGGKAGVSVAIVSLPSATRLRSAVLQLVAPPASLDDESFLLLPQAERTSRLTTTGASAVRI